MVDTVHVVPPGMSCLLCLSKVAADNIVLRGKVVCRRSDPVGKKVGITFGLLIWFDKQHDSKDVFLCEK